MTGTPRTAAVIGGGPAGLMAAEVLSAAGVRVTVYERMPSVARKLLIAGRGGLNLTHSEDFAAFAGRYGAAADWLRPVLEAFPPAALIAWAERLGQPTFVGSSGRVFPKAMKASPLLRAWLARLAGQGVVVRTRHDWRGWDEAGALAFDAPGGRVSVAPDVTVLALGGASWPKLGSNGAWTEMLRGRGVAVAPFEPANMGITIAWSDVFRERFAGQPLKNVGVMQVGETPGFLRIESVTRGDVIITGYGLEGTPIYALSAAARSLTNGCPQALVIDLRPDMTVARLAERVARAAPKQSLSNLLRKSLHLSPVEIGLLRETDVSTPREPDRLAGAIKAVALKVSGTQGLQRAISSAGGIMRDVVDKSLMLLAMPGVFVAGEMLDWEAPTGGYLLQASFATGVVAAQGALAWLDRQRPIDAR
ncbi:MAG: TIGR03862 family flavoprotein [Alphaproteobacteria bacterium]|nr:TIGR03862 family flavoprotein [Alphaproteobacteria bacterium]